MAQGTTMREFQSLTKRGQLGRYRRALGDALADYPIHVKSVRLVSDGSRPVFRVDTNACSYAAKFQNPQQHVLSQMYGEVQFLEYLSQHTDLRVESPLANSRGKLITQIHSCWLPEPAHLALTHWLTGRHLENAPTARSYHCLGRCAAELHKASQSFRPRNGFQILTNDRVYYWDEETILSRRDRKLLPKRRQELFRTGTRRAQRAIQRLWKNGKPTVIHNDLHPCNIKVHHQRLGLYDFEDITWGFPEQDIGTAMYHIRFRDDFGTLLDAFRRGYEEALDWPLASSKQLDSFVIARLLMFANYVVNSNIRPKQHLPRFQSKLAALLGGVS
ncbi:serine/threonine protein kinase [Gimesia fumaroli]|uniref:Serine/threonine protein kinase n=2 Tax=Gimesia fumaroli TaxID=2527976 RepID=A0A518IGM9_9PLAN|nr:serine/threonine protein kinase [Gimesia fumaroli]